MHHKVIAENYEDIATIFSLPLGGGGGIAVGEGAKFLPFFLLSLSCGGIAGRQKSLFNRLVRAFYKKRAVTFGKTEKVPKIIKNRLKYIKKRK